MARQNAHIGSHFDSWLDEEGIREEVTAATIQGRDRAPTCQRNKEDQQATDGGTYENQPRPGRPLAGPCNGSATIESLQRAARSSDASYGCNWCG